MIKNIKELNFPAYATLETATATISDMGDRTITSQVKIDGDVVPDFSYDWEVEFKGERYIHPIRRPQGTKDNTSRRTKIDMVFQHWAIYKMKSQYFVEMASTSAGTAIADKYIASLGLNLEDFVTAFNLVLNHYFGGRIIINLNPNPLQPYSKEAKFVSISYSYIWDVLQQIYEIYGVRWTLKTNADGVCEILMGYPAEEVSHIFEYGFEGGLLSVQHQVQSTDIRNRLLGRGGSKNLPYRYFKDKDPNNPLFEADPDWIPELANITFTELRGKTFRDYVRGWKAKRYGGTPMAEPTEAYLAGYNAEKFDPIEYVDDKESIEKYGILVGALENNEEIYPSIQGAPGEVDMIVDAEQVTDDDVDAAIENDAVETNVDGMSFTKTGVKTGEEVSINVSARNAKVYFIIPEGKKGTINEPSYTAKGKYQNYSPSTGRGGYVDVPDGMITVYRDKCSFTVHKKSTGEQVSRLNIPPGEYYYEAKVVASHAYTGEINLTASVSAIHLITSTDTDSGWHQTFDIWVRNIWGSSRKTGETDQQYADRVWLPILGDRMGNEARVVFASGWLSFSSDWEFPIVGYAFDDSKPGSEWRLTLAKSEAELEASGKYIPYEGYNASAGDRFFFIGINMSHQYVLWGEERVDDYKRDRLPETARINPSWVIKTDKVRLNQDRDGVRLIDSLSVGAQIRLASKQFISGAYESLYVQSMTYTWGADTILHPDVEIVVSDKVYTVKNPVVQIQGNIETLQRQMGSLSNIQQIIRQVCDQLYLRKDGVEDLSKSPTRFLGKVTGEKFRQGQIGGRDWGIYRDEDGNSVAEFDKIIIRKLLSVIELEINHVTHMGGMRIMSNAEMECIAVEEVADGYICFFDQKQGTKENLFAINDIVWSQSFNASEITAKYYKSIVLAIGDNYIKLSKSQYDGDIIPSAGDIIIHAGNTKNTKRQSIIIIDSSNNPSIALYRGVNSFELPDPETRIQSNNNIFTGRVVFTSGSSGLKNLSEWSGVEETINSKANQEDLDDFESAVTGEFKNLQDQIDGSITTWFQKGVPTLNNYPAVDWNTGTLKQQHVGDLYYDEDTGKAYRFQYNSTSKAYEWTIITDEAIAEALALAEQAQDTADGKRRVFTVQPTKNNAYDVGDLWVNATYGTTYSDDLLRCKTAKSEGTAFSIDHWERASKYTDDTAANEAKDKAQAALDAANTAKGEAKEATGAVNDLVETTLPALRDGVITESEKIAIEKYINIVNKEFADVTAAYEELSNNSLLPATEKTGLANAYNALTTAKDGLLAAIEGAILEDYTHTSKDVDTAYDTYKEKSASYSTAVEDAYYAIENSIDETAKAAKKATDDLNDDLIFTLTEKRDLRRSLKEINPSEGQHPVVQYYDITKRENLESAYPWTLVNDTSDPYFGWYQTSDSQVDKHSSYSRTKIHLRIYYPCDVRVFIASEAESTYDFVLLSPLDTELLASNLADSNAVATTRGNQSSKVISYTFSFTQAMLDKKKDYFITIKYKKDSSDSSSSIATDKGYYRIDTYPGSLNDYIRICGEKGLPKATFMTAIEVAEDLFHFLANDHDLWDDENTELEEIVDAEGRGTGKTNFRNEVYSYFQEYYAAIANLVQVTSMSDLQYLSNAFKDSKGVIDGGLMLGSFIGVGDTVVDDEDNIVVKAAMNGSSLGSDTEHGKLMLALGIPEPDPESADKEGDFEDRLSEATTRIYEDGTIITNSLDAKGKVESSYAIFRDYIVYKYSKIQDVCNSGTISSAYTLPAKAPTYILFDAQEHSGINPVLTLPSTYEEGRTITIACTPIISSMDPLLTLSGTMYLATNTTGGHLTSSVNNLVLPGGKVELLRAKNMWIVLTRISE